MMNSLRELCEFAGISRGAMEVAYRTGPGRNGLRDVGLLVDRGSPSKKVSPASMRAIVTALKNLPLITLEADIAGPRTGQEPLSVDVRVNVSEELVWDTTIYLYSAGGESILNAISIEQTESKLKHGIHLGPGQMQLIVERNGISTTGFVALKQDLGSVVVHGKPIEPEPIVEPPPPQPPIISVESSGDGSFKVSGSGFVPPSATVSIIIGVLGVVQNALVLNVTASNGAFQNFPTGNICSNHKGVTLYFWASDGRVYKGQQVKSNQVQLSCPF